MIDIGWPLIDHGHRDYQEDDQDGTMVMVMAVALPFFLCGNDHDDVEMGRMMFSMENPLVFQLHSCALLLHPWPLFAGMYI